ncbi:NmrA family NAD(P)-binding protein [Pseudochelatococcus sp. B33]
MTYIIHGATGAQGNPVLSTLRAAGKPVVAVTRSRRDRDLGDVPITVAEYTSVDQLTDAYRGAAGVFVHLPLGSEEARKVYAQNMVAALAKARPDRVVISTSGQIVDDPGLSLQQPDGSAIQTPVRGVKESGLSHAVISARLFLENLLLPPVIEGARSAGVLRYPLRADFPVSWSSHLDNADVAAALFERTDVGGVVAVGQLPPITGRELADAFAARFGKEVRYEAVTPQQFGETIKLLIGVAAAGVVGLYTGLASVAGYTSDLRQGAQKRLGLTHGRRASGSTISACEGLARTDHRARRPVKQIVDRLGCSQTTIYRYLTRVAEEKPAPDARAG